MYAHIAAVKVRGAGLSRVRPVDPTAIGRRATSLGRDRAQDVEASPAPSGTNRGEDAGVSSKQRNDDELHDGNGQLRHTGGLQRGDDRPAEQCADDQAFGSAEQGDDHDSERTVERSSGRVMPTARRSPGSRVRSWMESARVFAMPISAMNRASPTARTPAEVLPCCRSMSNGSET